ncbi:glycosyltransferase family 2 protein [Rhodocaloribacter sp.]
MTVSIILVAYHGDRWLPSCLASLAGSSARRLHLVLVDNSGNTIIDEVDLSAFDAEVLRSPKPLGFAEANNFALVRASHLEDVVLFLNQDTISPAGWVDACLEAMAGDASLGAVSPLIRTYDDDGWDPSFLACLDEEQRRHLTMGDESEALPKDNLTSGATLPKGNAKVWQTRNAPAPALLVRTDVLREVGPFDPVFGSYYEDYDLCRRIRQAGFRIGFATGAHVRHFSGSTTDTPEKERRRMRRIIRNRVLYQLREEGTGRRLGVLRWFGRDLPRRLVRGLMRTPSSQPPGVTLGAYGDLVRLLPRLVSAKRDEAVWQAYLHELGWVRSGRTNPEPVTTA